MITSTRNPKIQLVRDLLAHPKSRREQQAFVIEGVRLVEEALQSGWEAQWVLYTDDLPPRGQAALRGWTARGTPAEVVSPQVLKAISDTETPQGILAVLRMQSLPVPQSLDFILILDGLRDPGNMGTILRTAAAAGVQVVLLPRGATDPFSPKVVRSAMGAHFRLPVQIMSWAEIQAYIKPAHTDVPLAVYLADSSGGLAHTQADFCAPLALIVGGEAEGAGVEAQSLADTRVHIVMPGQAESLNAAIAAAILMFEVTRQRVTSSHHT
jgi:TrmH family RNA methyltransferase